VSPLHVTTEEILPDEGGSGEWAEMACERADASMAQFMTLALVLPQEPGGTEEHLSTEEDIHLRKTHQ
jgi:hypothetical protein